MALTRLYEVQEVGPELRRIYDDVRASFDLPFVPSLFKLEAAYPEYLKLMWGDLAPVVRSREFQSSAKALAELIRSIVISGGWRFSDQEQILASQKFSYNDIGQLGAIVATFFRSLTCMTLFIRLAQRGFSGGQQGRISNGKQASAVSRMITLNIPNEREAGLRAWLIYSDIRRTLGVRTVLSLFRLLSPYPAYMASIWLESKKVITDPVFAVEQDNVARRSVALLTGMPVKDHRALGKNIDPKQWRDIEELTDTLARILPQFALISAIWLRSFPHLGQIIAA
jgi:hypothetical protein